MDDLVLLAQMHGSGPDTVRALKEKGIHTARDLAGLDPVELERLAGLKPSSARKMVAAAIRMASGSGDSPAGFSREQREQEMAAGETVSAGSPPASSRSSAPSTPPTTFGRRSDSWPAAAFAQAR